MTWIKNKPLSFYIFGFTAAIFLLQLTCTHLVSGESFSVFSVGLASMEVMAQKKQAVGKIIYWYSPSLGSSRYQVTSPLFSTGSSRLKSQEVKRGSVRPWKPSRVLRTPIPAISLLPTLSVFSNGG